MTGELAGRVALVTGGGTGIGRAVAEAMAAAGADVAVTYCSNAAGAAAVQAAIAAAGRRALAVEADLTAEPAVAALMAAVRDWSGRVDILVNNAGSLIRRCPIAELPLDLWRRVLDVNVTSAFLVTRAVLPGMQARGQGVIINIASLAAHNGGGQNATPYAAAKAALIAFTKGLAKEAGPAGIRVNALAPGLIGGTPFHDTHSTAEGRAALVRATPLGREGRPEDVANAAVYLASDRAAFITGETLEINGGLSMR